MLWGIGAEALSNSESAQLELAGYGSGMGDGFIYDDGGVALDRQGITMRRYYFPIGRSKHIPYRRIRRVEARPMGWLTGKGRVWGSVPLRYWLPLDISRPRKDTLVGLDIGGHVKPAFSPDDPDRVLAILHQQTDRP